MKIMALLDHRVGDSLRMNRERIGTSSFHGSIGVWKLANKNVITNFPSKNSNRFLPSDKSAIIPLSMPGWDNPLPIGQSGWSIVRRWWERGLSGRVLALGAKARYPWARESQLVVHIGQSNPGGWRPRSSLQLAFSSPSSLQLAFFVFPPTHHP